MATVAQLAARSYQKIAYLFVVEGWPIMWTDNIELVGTGTTGSWVDSDDWTVALGLEADGSVRLEVDLETGMPVDTSRQFKLVDRDGHIIDYFEDEAGTAVLERLAPTDDPAPSTLLGYGGVNVDLYDRWLNGEHIGPNGERRQNQVLPAGGLPGYDHPSIDTTGVDMLRASTVQTAARHFEGRPCALYLLRKDPQTGEWPSWEDQHDSGYSLIYWGTIKNPPESQGHVWTFEVEGPGSWLVKTLNTSRPAEWRRVTPLLELSEAEAKIAISFTYMTAAASAQYADYSVYQLSVTSGQTPEELAAEINGHLQTVAASAGTDVTFTTFQTGKVKLTEDGLTISVIDNNGGTAYGGILRLRMHWKVWSHMGWDLSHAVQGRPEGTPLATPFEVESEEGSVFRTYEIADTPDPTTGFWTGIFTTLPLNNVWLTSPTLVDGDGATRLYKPYMSNDLGYGDEGIAVLQPEAKQVLDLGLGVADAPYFPEQLARPPADKTLDSGVCDSAGFLLIRGSFKTSVDGDVETRTQLAQVSWVDDGGKVAVEATDSRAIVWLEDWLDGRQWGGKDPALDKAWAGNDFEYMPVALLGAYNLGAPDHAHRVLCRLLLSSGTATWSGTGPGATITAGGNGHSDADDSPADDKEVADLGLCVPASMVDLLSFRAAAEALPGGISGPLNRTRLAFIGPFDAYATCEQIIKPRGWCFSLRGGQYGIFQKFAPLDVDDVEVALTQSDLAGAPQDLPPGDKVKFNHLIPIDLIEVKYGHNQLEESATGEKTLQVKARDPRSAQRRGNAKVNIDGRTLLADGSWIQSFTELWGLHAARWHAEPWSVVQFAVKGDKAKDLWPGTIVSYTSPWPATRNGAYGMTARIGRVLSVDRDLSSLTATIEVLIEGKEPTNGRRFAPIARLVDNHTTVEGRHDPVAQTLTCYADAFGRGGTHKDVAAFAEPSWSTTGGRMVVYLWQSWDGVEWEHTATLEVDSVNTTNNTITYDNISFGTVWENRYGILVGAPYDGQAAPAWPRRVFGALCDTDGKHSAANVAGSPWVE